VIAGVNRVGPGYCCTRQVPLLAGRDITGSDVRGQPLVAVITEAMARRFWPDGNTLGGRFFCGRPVDGLAPDYITVVGIARGTSGVGIGLGSLLIGVQALDPLTYLVVLGLMTSVALVACALPARRAAATNSDRAAARGIGPRSARRAPSAEGATIGGCLVDEEEARPIARR
jgi:hypothetical protein